MKNFKKQIDLSRNPILLTKEPKRSIHLVYQYSDTQEIVTVPNIWYNQLPSNRAADLENDAIKLLEDARKFRQNPSLFGYTPEMAENIAVRYEKRAESMKSKANEIKK